MLNVNTINDILKMLSNDGIFYLIPYCSANKNQLVGLKLIAHFQCEVGGESFRY